jgi:hypothetical protein
VGAEATEVGVVEQLPTADVIHIGAPFRVNGASPLFSSALLAAAPATDGTLESREVMNLDLRASAAVFSDGAAISMREAADEVGAVAWSWRAAGVPVIVLPRWTVDDQVSTPLLKTLHARLRAGDSPIVALRTARQAVRKDDATAAPFFWAGWVAVGTAVTRK